MALNNWNTKYGGDLSKLSNNDIQALSKFNQSYGIAQYKNANQVNTANQDMAARGMGQSSIRDNALNDLAGTLAQQYNILHTNYQSALMNDATSRTTLEGSNAAEQTYFNNLAVQNAQSITPSGVTNPSQAGAGSSGGAGSNGGAGADAHTGNAAAARQRSGGAGGWNWGGHVGNGNSPRTGSSSAARERSGGIGAPGIGAPRVGGGIRAARGG